MADSPLPPVPPVSPLPPPLPPQTPAPPDAAANPAAALSPFAIMGKGGNARPTPPPPVAPVPNTVQGNADGIAPSAPPPPTPSPPSIPSIGAVPPPPTPPVVTVEAPPPVAPASPAPTAVPAGSPLDEPLDTEHLLKEASSPAQPFILPNRASLPPAPKSQKPTEPGRSREEMHENTEAERNAALQKVQAGSRGEDKPSAGPAAQTLQTPAAPPLPPVDISGFKRPEVPSAPKSIAELTPPPPPPSAPTPASEPPKPTPSVAPPPGAPAKPPRLGLLAWVIGGVVAVVLLGGGLTVLALTGARIPVLSKLISGLDSTAPQAIAQAKTLLDTQGSYHFAGVGSIKLAESEQKTLTDTSSAIYQLDVKTKEGVSTDRGTRFFVSSEITGNANAAVPIALRSTGTTWIASFAANRDTTPATLAATTTEDTLLHPMLQPIPLEAVLNNAATEQAYTKVSLTNGRGETLPAALYTVSVKPAGLASYFPKGASIEAPTAKLALAWKSAKVTAAEPLDLELAGTFTYRDRKYTYSFHWSYDFWGDTNPTLADLKVLAELDPSSVTTALATTDVIARLGIDPNALPRGGEEVTPVVTTFTPIFPTGEVITTPQLERATIPPVPSQPATEEAKSRDIQRKHDLADLQAALEQYKKDHGGYPAIGGGEVQPSSNITLFNLLVPKYLSKMPVDPLNTTYYYAYNVIETGSIVTGYYLRSILEDHADAQALVGGLYHYYQLTNK